MQSTQVIAKNSIKIRSLCLGIKFDVTVGDETTGDEIVTGIAVAGIAVAEVFSCFGTQENKSKEPRSTNK